MKRGELKVTLNYSELADLFEKAKQHHEMCSFLSDKIKSRIEKAGVDAVWDGKERRFKEERREETTRD